jgi:alkylhydroperoxidase family enzyme
MTRVPPLPPKEWPPEMMDALAALSPANRRHPAPAADKRTGGRDALATFAHHPALARAFFTFNGHILWDTTLTPRQRQMVILRVATRRHATYIWGEHVPRALDVGLTDDEIDGITVGPDAPSWEPLDAALLLAVDELIDDGVISDGTWVILAAELDMQQLFDVVFTAGCYQTTSWLFASVGLEAGGTA